MKNLLLLIITIGTTTATAQWKKTSAPLASTNEYYTSLAVSANNIYAGNSESGVFLSTDNGATWNAIIAGLGTGKIQSLAASGPNVYAGTLGLGTYLSSNSGASWSKGCCANSTDLFYYGYSVAISSSNVFVGGAKDRIFTSTVGGTNWTEADNGIPIKSATITSIVTRGTKIFAGDETKGVFLSQNNGASWTAVNTGLTSLSVTALATDVTHLFAGTFANGVFLSVNDGSSWTAVSNGLPSGFQIKSLVISGSTLLASIESNGVYASADNGTTWKAMNQGIETNTISQLAVAGTDVYAAADNGVWKRPLSEIVGIEERSSITRFYLFPNPGTTSIYIETGSIEKQTLQIYNMNGSLVLIQSINDKATIDVTNLNEGIYSVRLVSDEGVTAKKLVIIK